MYDFGELMRAQPLACVKDHNDLGRSAGSYRELSRPTREFNLGLEPERLIAEGDTWKGSYIHMCDVE